MRYLASKGDQMVLAQGEDLNVLYNHELVVILVEYSAINNVAQILFVALCEEQQRFRVPVWRRQQALAVGILADAFENRPDGASQLLQALGLFLVCRLFPLARALAGPAETVKVDGGVLRVRALGATGG